MHTGQNMLPCHRPKQQSQLIEDLSKPALILSSSVCGAVTESDDIGDHNCSYMTESLKGSHVQSRHGLRQQRQ